MINKRDHFDIPDNSHPKNQSHSYNVFQLVESNFSSVNSNDPKAMAKANTEIESDRKSD